MTRAMQDWGRLVAVAGVSAGVGAVLGALGIVGYRRIRDASGGDTLGLMTSGNAMNDVVPHGDARFEASRVEAIKMDESPSTFAAGDEVGGDVIGEALSGLVENDRGNEVAEGNYRAADGLHTEEMPRNKGPKGKRAPNGARTRKALNGHNGH